jgi:glycosidase
MDSHDTARTLWTVGEDESALRLCALFQMTMPGAPCIYYGDEIGMTGANDPFCARGVSLARRRCNGISRCSTSTAAPSRCATAFRRCAPAPLHMLLAQKDHLCL